jgi:hypothetical protein
MGCSPTGGQGGVTCFRRANCTGGCCYRGYVAAGGAAVAAVLPNMPQVPALTPVPTPAEATPSPSAEGPGYVDVTSTTKVFRIGHLEP